MDVGNTKPKSHCPSEYGDHQELNMLTVDTFNEGTCNRFFFLVYSTSELMYDVLDESVRRAEINHNMTYGRCKAGGDVWIAPL